MRDLRPVRRWESSIPARIGLSDAVDAPSLLMDPLPHAVLVLRASLDRREITEAWSDGELAILGANGQWRRLTSDDVSLLEEGAFELSRDGSLLAVADHFGVSVIEVATGDHERFSVPFKEPIGLEWTPDNAKVHMSDRYTPRRERPILLDVSDGTITEVAYSIFGIGFQADGTPIETRVVDVRRGTAVLRTYSGPRKYSTTAIKSEDISSPQTAVGRMVAVQRESLRSRACKHPEADTGTLVVNPATGRPLALLPMRMCGIELVGWIGPETVLLGDGGFGEGRGGYLLAWNWATSQRRLVTRFAPGKVNYAIATGLLASLIEAGQDGP